MGLQYGFENIRNVRSGKGVFNGCDVTNTGNTLNMTAGRVKFGITAANYTALGEQYINEGGTEQAVLAASYNAAALADGTYVLFLRTDGTLDIAGEAETQLPKGPMITVNQPGLTPSPNVMTLDTPSIRLCQFTKTAGNVVASSISYNQRETMF